MTDATQQRLRRLQGIASLLADQALLPVTKASEDVRRIEARINDLASHRSALTSASGDPALAGTLLSQAERLRKQQARAIEDLDAARLRFEKEKAKAARAVGKDLVLTRLIEERETAARLEARRRKLR